MNKTTITIVAIIAITAFATLAGTQVSAMGFGENHNTMIQRFAQAFGKSETEVEEVFSQIREEHHQEMLSSFNTRLEQAVTDGKITTQQRDLILQKHEELHQKHMSQMEEFHNLTPEERRSSRQAEKAELQTWADQNGIDLSYFGMGRGMMNKGHGRGMGMHSGYNNR